jgi:protein-tyrosine phosphatase
MKRTGLSVPLSRAAFLALFIIPALVGLGGCASGSNKQGQSIPFTEASVSLSATDAGHDGYKIAWKAPGVTAVSVYAGKDPLHINYDVPVLKGDTTGQLNVDMPSGGRWYFALTPDRGGSLVVADRSLHLATAPNFRDAGGYRAADGKWVRMGLLYRSDQLDRLGPEDLATLHADGIHLVCDLRTDAERAQGKDRLPDGAVALIADVAGSNSNSSNLGKMLSDPGQAERMLGDGRGAQLMIEANRQFVSAPSALAAYKAVFERLADPAMLPGVYHCTAGKDRTGWAQAVFLSIMGVPRDTILRDYLLSNEFLQAKNDRMYAMVKGRMDPDWLRPLMEVWPDYLNAAFDEVDKRYGSMDRYLHEGLGLSDQTLQALRHEFLAG